MGLVYVKELDANYPIAGEQPTREEYDAIIGEVEKAHYKDTAKRGLVGNITWPADLAGAAIGGLGSWLIGGSGAEELQKDVGKTFGAPRKLSEEALGVKYIAAPTDESRYIGSAINFASGGLLPGAALASRMGSMAGKVGAFAGDVLASGAQGIAAEAGRDIGQEFGGETGGNVGSLLASGAMGLASGFTRAMGQKAATKISDLYSKSKGDAVFETAKNERVAHGLEQIPNLEERIRRQIELQDQYPQYRPNLAQATESPSLLEDARVLQKRTPERLNQAKAAYQNQLKAVDDISATQFPSVPHSTAPLAAKAKEVRAGLDKQLAEAEDQLKQISGRDFLTDSSQAGKTIREFIKKKHDEVYEGLKSRYNEFDNKYGDLPIGMESIAKTVRKYEKDEGLIFQRPEMPKLFSEIKELMEEPKKERTIIVPKGRGEREVTGTETLRMLTSLDRRLNMEYRNVLKNGTPLERAFVVELRSKVNDKLSELEKSGMKPPVSEYMTIKKDFARYADIYRSGAVREILKKDPLKGEFDVAPNYIVPGKLFTRTGNTRDVEANLLRFRKSVEQNGAIPKEAMDAVSNEVAALYLKRANASGEKIGKNSAEKFLREYSVAFKAMPELKKQYENVDVLIKDAYASVERAANKVKAFSTTPVSKILDTEEPMNAVSDVLKSKKMTIAAVNQALKAKKHDDLASAVARYVLDSKNPEEAFSEKNVQLALSTLSPKKKQTLKDIIEMKRAIESQQPGKAESYLKLPVDELEKRFGSKAGNIAAMYRNVKTGHIGTQTMMTSLLVKFKELRQKGKMADMLDNAIHNTELADALAYVKKNDGKIDKKSEAVIGNYLKALAAKEAAFASQPEDEENAKP